MKKILLLLFFIVPGIKAVSQNNIVINDRLLVQVSKNNVVRQTSIRTFASVYKKQKELYEDGEKQMMQVMAIHEYIYQQLYNVNSLFKQGKQMKYIYEYAKQIPENGAEMLRLSAENPQHSVWLKDYYQTLFEQMVGLMTQIEEVLLKSDKDLLMDAADRNELISKIYYKLRQINVSILSVTNLIQFGKNRAYIYSIPILGNYVSQDKMLVESIFDKYKRLQTKY